MTLTDLQRAALVMYAARECEDASNLAAMKAICYVIRNRVRAHWHDGVWLAVIERASEVAGNQPSVKRFELTVTSRHLQMLARDIDQVFYGTGEDMELADAIGDPAKRETRPAHYFQWVNRPPRRWFVDNIVQRPDLHPRRAQLGTLIFFE